MLLSVFFLSPWFPVPISVPHVKHLLSYSTYNGHLASYNILHALRSAHNKYPEGPCGQHNAVMLLVLPWEHKPPDQLEII